MKENIGLFLTKRALLSPDHEALVETEPERRLTYRKLNARCNQAAHGWIILGAGAVPAPLLERYSELGVA